MKKASANPCRSAVIKTLSYTGVFGFPLSFYQITNNLISKNRFSNSKIKRELEKLTDEKVIKKAKGKYLISGIKRYDIEKRAKNTEEIIRKNKPTIKILSKVPWIKMIAITGSVANQNTEMGADIDLLFITEKDRLWISRGFVFLILKTLGKLPADKSKREICPNIFIDESNMAWAKKKRNLYVAQNIISMKPFTWRDNIYFEFIRANKWITNYYVNFKINFPKKNEVKKHESITMKFIESIARKRQIKYMKKDITTEVVNQRLIHFNKNDSSKKILVNYKKIFKKAVGS